MVDLDAAFAAIDAANGDDPFTLVVRGVERPKEIAHADLAVEYVRLLATDASDALLLAARAHHIRRWDIPRSSEPEGRKGYLRWRLRLERYHAEIVGRVLGGVGVDVDTIVRVQEIIRKERLKVDPEVKVFEDALCLVFVETQFAELAAKLDEAHMVEVVAKTLKKMTPAGIEAASAIPLDPDSQRILALAAGALAS